jgi:hypothetical protein
MYKLLFFCLTYISIPNFSFSQDPFITKYEAIKRSQRCYTITEDINHQFGSVWWREKIDFSQDTSLQFVLYMGDKDGNGADGIAFVMHNDPQDTISDKTRTWNAGGKTYYVEAATGDRGGGLGFGDHIAINGQSLSRISPSVTIEFDTWDNNDSQDGREVNNWPRSPYDGWDHTAVVYNGNMYTEQQMITDNQGNTDRILPVLPILDNDGNMLFGQNKNLEDGRCYTYQVKWKINTDNTQTLELWVESYDNIDDTENMNLVMTHTDDMINKVFGGETLFRIGFTGSTGGARNEHTICLLGENLKPEAVDDYFNYIPNTTNAIDIQANDYYPDSDYLHLPIIIDLPNYGTAQLFDSLDTNYLRYIPNTNYIDEDSLQYIICDINSTKCYSKCDTATVYFNSNCEFNYYIEAFTIRDNNICDHDFPDNGQAFAKLNTIDHKSIWLEDFNLPNGLQIDDGETGWRTDTTEICSLDFNFETNDGAFGTNAYNCTLYFSTEEIDISNHKSIVARINYWIQNPSSTDELEIYYSIDGREKILFEQNGVLNNSKGNITIAQTNELVGSTIQIFIEVRSASLSSLIFWDDIEILEKTGTISNAHSYQFNWYYNELPLPNDQPDFVGDTVSQLAEGKYYVVAKDTTANCYSLLDSVSITRTTREPKEAFVELLSHDNSCTDNTGELRAGVVIDNDSIYDQHSYEWYNAENELIRQTNVASGLSAGLYNVIIRSNLSGCDTILFEEILEQIEHPNLEIEVLESDSICTEDGDGKIRVHFLPAAEDFQLDLFDANNSTNINSIENPSEIHFLKQGDYFAIGKLKATGCPSDTAYFSIDSIECSEVITSTLPFASTDITVFPNPTGNWLLIEGLENESDYVVEIIKPSGKVVLSKKSSQSLKLYPSVLGFSLSAGIVSNRI